MDRKKPRPLLPIIPWAEKFGKSLLSKKTNFRRNVVGKRLKETTQILRVGTQLIDTIYDQLLCEDRGTAFATWRKVLPSEMEERMYFKLCYVITSELPEGLSDDEKKRLRSRMISYLPSWTEVIYIDREFEVVTHPTFIEILSHPYRTDQDPERKIDHNLANKTELLFNYIDSGDFKKMCLKIRADSEEWLMNQDDYKEKVSNCVINGEIDLSQRNNRLLQKINNVHLQNKSELEREIEINEELLKVLSKPKVKLDAIGIIILSSKSPEEYAMEVN